MTDTYGRPRGEDGRPQGHRRGGSTGKPGAKSKRPQNGGRGGQGGRPAENNYGRGPSHTTQRSQPKPDYQAIIDKCDSHDGHTEDGVRLQKVLASAGVGSRRKCEVLIEMGLVRVNGQRVTTLGIKVDPTKAIIHVKDQRLEMPDGTMTIALNKPRLVVSAMSDPEGRRDLNEFIEQYDERLYHVGRLDYETEGLLLLTNDGELAHRLSHPSFEVSKTYVIEVVAREGFPRKVIRDLLNGVALDDGLARADKAHVLDEWKGRSLIELTLHEGRNRIVRRMFDAIGYPVERLVRTDVGPIQLGDLRPGESRVITGKELQTLRREVRL